MSEKKPYVEPKIFEVELNQEQAILANCSVGVTNISSNVRSKCTTTCKRAGSGGNSAAHPS